VTSVLIQFTGDVGNGETPGIHNQNYADRDRTASTMPALLNEPLLNNSFSSTLLIHSNIQMKRDSGVVEHNNKQKLRDFSQEPHNWGSSTHIVARCETHTALRTQTHTRHTHTDTQTHTRGQSSRHAHLMTTCIGQHAAAMRPTAWLPSRVEQVCCCSIPGSAEAAGNVYVN